MYNFFEALGNWAFLVAGELYSPIPFFDSLTPGWWFCEHYPANHSCIANRAVPDNWIYDKDKGWIQKVPFFNLTHTAIESKS